MLFPRASGVLLHPTSLPGRYGLGDLGDYAYRFVDLLHAAGQSYWQVLPLGPTSYGDSPYQSLSTFAGNPNLISFDKLAQLDWLTGEDLASTPSFPADRVDYGPVIEFHNEMLDRAYARFLEAANDVYREALQRWTAISISLKPMLVFRLKAGPTAFRTGRGCAAAGATTRKSSPPRTAPTPN